MKRSLILAASLVLGLLSSSIANAQYRPNERVVIEMKIDSWMPREGEVGTLVTLSGSGFTRKMQVLVGGRSAQIAAIGARSLSFRIPASYGSGEIVLRKTGMAQDYQVGTFAVWSNPSVTGFSPVSGTIGTKVEIRGKHFTQSDKVYLGSQNLRVERWSSNALIVEIPQGGTSDYLVVKNPRGVEARSPRTFTLVAPAPYITSFMPQRGQPGTIVRIIGGNYDRDMRVSYGRQDVAITRSADSWIEIAIPSNANRSWPISITSRRGAATSPTDFDLELAPILDSYAPTWGRVGTRVTLRGNNFATGDRVSIAGQNCKIVSLRGNTITVEIPDHARSGIFAVHHGGHSAELPTPFEVLYQPQLSGVAPLGGAPGTRVRITGQYLGDSKVYLGNLEVAPIAIRDNEIDFIVPERATSAALRVVSRGGEGSYGKAFEVWNYPSITKVSPTRGPVGSAVTIYGSMLANATHFYLGQVAMPIIARNRDGSIILQVPAGARDGTISWAAYGKDNPTNWRYDVLAAPAVSGFGPTEGAPGTRVTITGTGFDAATRVFYGGDPARVWQWQSNRLTVEIPSNAVRSDYLRVENVGGQARAATPFALFSAPSLARYSDYSAKPGSEIYLWGDALGLDTIISFGTHDTRVLRVNPDKSIVIAVPAIPAGQYQISAQNRGMRTVGRKRFTVEAWAEVTAIAPGSAKVGDTIELSGSGLQNAQVWFGSYPLAVMRADRRGHKLWVQIPKGCAGSSPLTIVDGAHTSSSSVSLRIETPAAPPPKVRDHRNKNRGKGPKVRDHRRGR